MIFKPTPHLTVYAAHHWGWLSGLVDGVVIGIFIAVVLGIGIGTHLIEWRARPKNQLATAQPLTPAIADNPVFTTTHDHGCRD